MKYLDLDWAAAFPLLDAWGSLPVEARRAVLKMQMSQGLSVGARDGVYEPLMASGLVLPTPNGRRVLPTPAFRPVIVALRAMSRRPVWDAADGAALQGYVEEHLTTEEATALVSGHPYGSMHVIRSTVAGAAGGEEWLEDFLAADDQGRAVQWEKARMPRGAAPAFAAARRWEAARAMVRTLAALREPVPLCELPSRFPDVPATTLGPALGAALRYLLLFAALRAGDLEPMVGGWPPAVARLGAPAPPPPPAVETVETFETAWLADDMAALLSMASAEPVRLRGSDGAIFARTRDAVVSRLVSVPAWAASASNARTPDDDEDDDGDAGALRAEYASTYLQVLKLADRAGHHGQDLRLAPTTAGKRWLAQPPEARLKTLLDPLRGSAERNPAGWYDDGGTGMRFFPMAVPGVLRKGTVNCRAVLTRLLLAMPEGMVEVGAFAEHAGRSANPFIEAVGRGLQPMDYGWGSRVLGRREWEHVWSEIVSAFVLMRLVPLGAAALGRTAAGRVAFRLTSAGRYLLGAADDFSLGEAEGKHVVVQPDFEVVFLAPAPRAEAAIARFAQRVGRGIGVMFRLTRASVLAAAEGGMTAAEMADTLRGVSARPLPGNVERQLRDWLAAVRRVSLRPAVLVECPDKETTAAVASALGKQVTTLTPTVLSVAPLTTGERAALVKKLRAGGVFVD
jgi:hypothetical protein